MDKEQTAIERLRTASEMSIKHYGTPLVVTTSGGKDSSICVALAERAGIPFEVIHNHTTVDAPETVYFVREDFRRLEEKGVKCTIDFIQPDPSIFPRKPPAAGLEIERYERREELKANIDYERLRRENPYDDMANFEKIAASPETLGMFLASLPIASGPWDEAFHRMFCDGCQAEDCGVQDCPHKVERGNPLWWLMREAGEKQGRQK